MLLPNDATTDNYHFFAIFMREYLINKKIPAFAGINFKPACNPPV